MEKEEGGGGVSEHAGHGNRALFNTTCINLCSGCISLQLLFVSWKNMAKKIF